jgi:hypothetical protein
MVRMSKAKELLELIGREASEAANVAHLKRIRDDAQTRCYEAQQRLFALQSQRFALVNKLAGEGGKGAQGLLCDLVIAMTEPQL